MSNIDPLLINPFKRTVATYRFKVTALQGNTVSFHDASMVTQTRELPNPSNITYEEQFIDYSDNLFLAVDINNEFYFTTKLTNNLKWPDAVSN